MRQCAVNLFLCKSTLHVSGGTEAHHQEYNFNCINSHWYNSYFKKYKIRIVESSWNVMAHGDAREEKWRGNWRMEWVASTLHTISEHDVFSITTADAQISAANIRLNLLSYLFKWTRPFRRMTKSGFWACVITFQTQSINIFTKYPASCQLAWADVGRVAKSCARRPVSVCSQKSLLV